MEEALCHIEIIKEENEILAVVQSELGGIRQYSGNTLNEALRQLTIELREEFDSITVEEEE